MKFNINGYVRVRLTDEGRARHRKNHDDLFSSWPQPPEYRAPQEDANGWSEWQMWQLMSEFGSRLYNGCRVPFETEIEIVEDVRQQALEQAKTAVWAAIDPSSTGIARECAEQAMAALDKLKVKP